MYWMHRNVNNPLCPRTGRVPVALWAMVAVLWVVTLWTVPASAQQSGGDRQTVSGDTINISGFMERPRADTRIRWVRPEAFDRKLDVVIGARFRAEVMAPVDRKTMIRRMELDHALRP